MTDAFIYHQDVILTSAYFCCVQQYQDKLFLVAGFLSDAIWTWGRKVGFRSIGRQNAMNFSFEQTEKNIVGAY